MMGCFYWAKKCGRLANYNVIHIWLVVSLVFNFYPYLGWNHQRDNMNLYIQWKLYDLICRCFSHWDKVGVFIFLFTTNYNHQWIRRVGFESTNSQIRSEVDSKVSIKNLEHWHWKYKVFLLDMTFLDWSADTKSANLGIWLVSHPPKISSFPADFRGEVVPWTFRLILRRPVRECSLGYFGPMPLAHWYCCLCHCLGASEGSWIDPPGNTGCHRGIFYSMKIERYIINWRWEWQCYWWCWG